VNELAKGMNMRITKNPFFHFLALCLPITATAATKIHNANDLHQQLVQGCDVRAIVDTHFCENSTPYGDGVTRVDFSTFNIYEVPDGGAMKKVIATSMSALTHHRTYGPIIGYSRLRVSYDNSVQVFSEYIDIKTGSSLESYTVACHIDKGVDLISDC
jgi:hypothetical protein